MYMGSSMLYKTDITTKLYNQLAELEEKLAKSEAERKNLEMKFEYLAESYKDEEKKRVKQLNEKYNEFVQFCKERNDRNEKIMRSLERVEIGANAVFAKTERLKQLRSHYNAYLNKIPASWSGIQTADGSQHLSQQRILEPFATSSNQSAVGFSPGAGDGIITEMHASGGGSSLVGSGIRRIGYGPIYVIPEKEFNVFDDGRYKSNQLLNAQPQTLGEAGMTMLKELNRESILGSVTGLDSVRYNPPENFSFKSPAVREDLQQYPRYGLWPHVPNPPCGTEALNYALRKSKPVPSSTRYSNTDYPSKQSWVENPKPVEFSTAERRENNVKLQSPKRDVIVREKSRDNFEIECLSADGNYYDEDHNLSDDEVLDGALNRSSLVNVEDKRYDNGMTGGKFVDANGGNYHKNEADFRQQTAEPNNNIQYQIPAIEEKENHIGSRPSLAGRIILENVAKRSVATHQKSVEELKAMLSFEEEEIIETRRMPDDNEDEDVPEDFIEQPWPDDHYDPRYENDVSRNVILEEEEPEDNYEEVRDERRHERKDWRSVQHFRQQGKLVPNGSSSRDNFDERPMYSQPEVNASAPLPNYGYPENNQPRPRMLTNAVNLFKDRRKSVSAESVPASIHPSSNLVEGIDDLQVDKTQGPPIQKNVGNFLRGLVEKERRKSSELREEATPPRDVVKSPQSQDRPKAFQKNVGNYLRNLAGKERAREKEQRGYVESEQRPDNPRQSPHYVTENMRADPTPQQYGPGEEEQRFDTAALNVRLENEDVEHLYGREADEYRENTNNEQAYSDSHYPENYEPRSSKEQERYMHEENEFYPHPDQEELNGNNMAQEEFYYENPQRFEQYNPESMYQAGDMESTERQDFDPSSQNYLGQNYPEEVERERLEEGTPYANQHLYAPNEGEIEDQGDHYPGATEYPESGQYNADGLYHGEPGNYEESNIHPGYQDEVDGNFQRQNENYREGEFEPYPGEYEQYEGQQHYFSEEPQGNHQELVNADEYRQFEAPNGTQYVENNYANESQNEPINSQEKGQAEYEGQRKEEAMPQTELVPDSQEAKVETNVETTNIKPSVMAQLIDSESESFQVSAQPAQDDSDFDFSMGK